MSDWNLSIEHCRKTLNCHAQMDQLALAADAYRQALAINPRMPTIAQAVQRIERKLKNLNDSSGTFDCLGQA
jgi:hypothetical protein